MKRIISTKLKAGLLLGIFGLNIIVGFACSLGVDMGFNTAHHHEEQETVEVHVHADGEKHHHENTEHKHLHTEGKDNCCNDKVLNIEQADKTVPQPQIIANPLIVTAFIVVYYNFNISNRSQLQKFNKYFVLGHHPPDIRIAIQSFQI